MNAIDEEKERLEENERRAEEEAARIALEQQVVELT